MHIKINKHGNKPLSVDCVFETRTIAFSSPGEYMATLLNYDWQAFCNTYAHCTINMDPELLPKLSAEFYQQFSLLSPNLRELVYSLLFEDATYKYFSDNLLQHHLTPKHKHMYRDLLHFNIPLVRELNSKLSDFCSIVHHLTLSSDKKYKYDHLCHTLNFVFDFAPIIYPSVDCAECFVIMEKWLCDSHPHIICEYRKALSKLLAAREKHEFICAVKEIKNIFKEANLWETNDYFAEYLEYAQQSKYASVQDLSLLFVESFYRSLENYKDLSFKTAVANSLFSDYNPTNTSADIYLCADPITFLLSSFLCCYKYNTPLARCARCYKFFARSTNQQKLCKSPPCQAPAIKINRILSKELFGEDLYNKLTTLYKRLTYHKSAPGYDAYTKFKITPNSSKKLVCYFIDLARRYNEQLDSHVEMAHKLSREGSPFLDRYIDTVRVLFERISSYYTKKGIGAQISAALENTNTPDNQWQIYILEYHFDLANHGWDIYSEPHSFKIEPQLNPTNQKSKKGKSS